MSMTKPSPANVRSALETLIEVAGNSASDKAARSAAVSEGLAAIKALDHLLSIAVLTADSLSELVAGGFVSAERARKLYGAIAAARGEEKPTEPYRQNLF